jgi:hypothetical protein
MIQEETGCKIVCFVSTTSEIVTAINEHYGKTDKKQAIPEESETEDGEVKVFSLEEEGKG